MYSGSQKCLSAPPGGAPFAMSERAMEKLKGRKTKPATFNLDMNLIGDYWGWFNSRSYHHTGGWGRECRRVCAADARVCLWGGGR